MKNKILGMIFGAALLAGSPAVSEAQEIKPRVKIDLGAEYNIIEGPVHEWGGRMFTGLGLESEIGKAYFDINAYIGLKKYCLKKPGSNRGVDLFDSYGMEFGGGAGAGINLPEGFILSADVRYLHGFYFLDDARPSNQLDMKILFEKKFGSVRLGIGIFDSLFSGYVGSSNYLSNDLGACFRIAVELGDNEKKTGSIEFECKTHHDEYDSELRGAAGVKASIIIPDSKNK